MRAVASYGEFSKSKVVSKGDVRGMEKRGTIDKRDRLSLVNVSPGAFICSYLFAMVFCLFLSIVLRYGYQSIVGEVLRLRFIVPGFALRVGNLPARSLSHVTMHRYAIRRLFRAPNS